MTDELDPLIMSLMDAPVTLRPEIVEELDHMAEVLLSKDSSSVLHLSMSLGQELGIVIKIGLSAIEREDHADE